ncbi:hypothetical protein [Streptomyces hawaiiensis]|uniref:hypothetical protein n=1 Tax=Streptomyces hawaiiensis TaxID=67305 RepID=UPI001FEB3B88|nr:hypothetical protein [Streptomyces hawaiiensis]
MIGDAVLVGPHELWQIQEALDFPGTVYGIPRGTSMREVMALQAGFYGAHRDDVTLDGPA